MIARPWESQWPAVSAHGVRSAMPTFEAQPLCPDGFFRRGSMRRYGCESRRIFETFRRFTPVVQGLSLDAALLDISGTGRLFGPPVRLPAQPGRFCEKSL